MTLSIKRAIEHGGLLERVSSEVSDGGLFFLAPGGYPIGVVLSDDGEVEVFSGGKEHYTAIAVVGETSLQRPVFLQATVSGGVATLKAEAASRQDFTLMLGADRANELHAGVRGFSESLPPHSPSELRWDWDAISLQSLNNSLIEGFMWAQVMREVRSENTVTEVVQSVSAYQILLETSPEFRRGKSVPDDRVIELDFSHQAETPGVPLRVGFGAEYDDARNECEGDLNLRDICDVAKTSTCFGGDAPCTYDDYVFARAAGECASCAQQTQVRNKFKVK